MIIKCTNRNPHRWKSDVHYSGVLLGVTLNLTSPNKLKWDCEGTLRFNHKKRDSFTKPTGSVYHYLYHWVKFYIWLYVMQTAATLSQLRTV